MFWSHVGYMSHHQRASLLKSPPNFCFRIIEVAKTSNSEQKVLWEQFFQINVLSGLAFAKPAYDMKGLHFMKKPGMQTFHLWLYLNCPLIKESLSFCNIIVIACHIIFVYSWGGNHTFTISIQPKIDRPFHAFI